MWNERKWKMVTQIDSDSIPFLSYKIRLYEKLSKEEKFEEKCKRELAKKPGINL